MNPLFLTITFLMLLGVMTMAQVKRFTSHRLQHLMYEGHLSTLSDAEKLRAEALLQEIREVKETHEDKPIKEKIKKTAPKPPIQKIYRSVPLNFDLARPPNNSRFNFYPVLAFEKEAHYEWAASLLRELYSSFHFFQRIPSLEYVLLDGLIEKKEEALQFMYPEDLGSLSLENDDLQEALFIILRGGQTEEGTIPSLLNYISFDKTVNNKNSPKMKINLLFASYPILKVILGHEGKVKRWIEAREKIWEVICFQEAHREDIPKEKQLKRTEISERVRALYEEIGGDKNSSYLDFTLGKPGTILFVEDTRTKIIKREKILPRPTKGQA